MTMELTLNSSTKIEFGFGKLVSGKEQQVFAEYFPSVRPAMEDYGLQSLRPFAIIATNHPGPIPTQGSFTRASSIENYQAFHNDPRFLAAKHVRDEGMEFLTGGSFFDTTDAVIRLSGEQDYAVVIAENNPIMTTPVFQLAANDSSPNAQYIGKKLSLHPWSENAEQLLAGSETIVFRIRFLA
ncbi:hypothetical protein [Microbulbifer sp. JTAC008]|uniref:hypothetical protein n=1 Tax=unclassified Microbulbifer TaxID=2619833 RepID=UPI00403A11BF